MKRNRKLEVVIIGGGTSGLAAAANLSNDFQITIIEKYNRRFINPIYNIPLGIGLAFRNKKNGIISDSLITVDKNREIPLFSPKLLGGSSRINGTVHTIGSEHLWENTSAYFGISKFEFEEAKSSCFRPYFEKSSNKISIRTSFQSELDNAFQKAVVDCGINFGLSSEQNQPSVGPIINNCGKFFRSSALNFIKNKKIKILCGAEPVYFETGQNKKITSLKLSDGRKVKGDLFVVCSGVINTIKLVKELAEKSNLVDTNKLGIGIKDHVNVRINVKSKRPFDSLNEIWPSNAKKVNLLAKHLVGKTTLMVGTGATTAVNCDLDGDGIVDTRVNLLAFSESGRHGIKGGFDPYAGFSLSLSTINPVSSGNISFNSSGYQINPNYFSHDYDKNMMVKTLETSKSWLKNSYLNDWVDVIANERELDQNPLAYAKKTFYSGHHLIGGLGKVINQDFSVGDIKNLFACDASVLSDFPASNIHAPIAIIGAIVGRRLSNIF